MDVEAALARARGPGPPRLEVLGPVRPPERLGLVPGSFDPVTLAHLALAEALGVDVALLIYSPVTLPKEPGPGGDPGRPLLDPAARVRSLLEVCAGRRDLRPALCSHGLLADLAEAAAGAFPRSAIEVGVGSDKVIQLFDPRWYEDRDAALDRLFGAAGVAYAVRPGEDGAVEAVIEANPRWRPRLRRVRLPAAFSGVSSRAVRDALRSGRDVSGWVPGDVRPFLERAAG